MEDEYMDNVVPRLIKILHAMEKRIEELESKQRDQLGKHIRLVELIREFHLRNAEEWKNVK